MVERSRKSRRRRRSKQPLLGNHQRCWIWGRHLVQETLAAGKWPIYELVLSEDLSGEEREAVCGLADQRDVPYGFQPHVELANCCGSQEHQGYLAKMPPFPYTSREAFEQNWPMNPLVLVLDGIQDPYNFGAMLRSAEVLGADAVLVGENHQAEVTSLVARSSAGAVNHIPIVRQADLTETLTAWKSRGLRIVGGSEKASKPIYDAELRGAIAVVIGNEGRGIAPERLELCDELVTIPQSGSISSLNAAVSAGVLLYEVQRQRKQSSQ